MMRLSALCLLLFIAATNTQAADGIAESFPDRTEEMLVAAECSYRLTGEENEETGDNDQTRIEKCFKENLDKTNEAKYIRYLYGYISPSRLGVDAFYWVKTKCGDYILSFRGTLPLSHSESHGAFDDYILNLKFWQSVADWINNAKIKGSKSGVHYGFYESWSELKRHLSQAKKSQKSDDNSEICADNSRKKRKANLYITGHSKGGALATLAAQYLASSDAPDSVRFDPDRVFVFTFEAPMVLEKENAKIYNNLKIKEHHRFEYYNDPVPLLPVQRDFYTKLDYHKFEMINKLVFETDFVPVGDLLWYDKENQIVLKSTEAANQKREDFINSFSIFNHINDLLTGKVLLSNLLSTSSLLEAIKQHSLCNTWMTRFKSKPNLCPGQLVIAASTELSAKEHNIKGVINNIKGYFPNAPSFKTKKNGDLGNRNNIIAALFLLACTAVVRIISEPGLFYSIYRQSIYFISQWTLCIIATYICYFIANNYSVALGSRICLGSGQLTDNFRSIGKAVDLFASCLIFLAAWALATKSRLKLKTVRAVKLWALVLACSWLALGLEYGSSKDNLTLIYLATPGAIFNTLAFFALALACATASGWVKPMSINNSGIASAVYVNPDNALFSQSQSKCLILLFPACFLYAWLQIPAYLYSFWATESTADVVQGLRSNLFMGKIFFGISLLGVPLLGKLGSKFGLDTWLKFAILILAALVQLISFAKNLFGMDIAGLFKSVAEPLAF